MTSPPRSSILTLRCTRAALLALGSVAIVACSQSRAEVSTDSVNTDSLLKAFNEAKPLDAVPPDAPPEPEVDHYVLKRVGRRTLPAPLPSNAMNAVDSGFVELRPGNQYRMLIAWSQVRYGGSGTPKLFDDRGTYTRDGNTISFESDGPRARKLKATVNEKSLSFSADVADDNHLLYTFAK